MNRKISSNTYNLSSGGREIQNRRLPNVEVFQPRPSIRLLRAKVTIADLNKPDKFHNREAEGIVDWLTKKSGPQWTEVNSKVKAKQSNIQTQEDRGCL